VGLQKPRND